MNGRMLRLYSTIAAMAELDKEPFYKLMWHLLGVKVLDHETLNHVLADHCDIDQVAHGVTTARRENEVAQMTALAKHISTLEAKILEDIFGPVAKHAKEAIKHDILAKTLAEMGEAPSIRLCAARGGVEGVMRIKESSCVSKLPMESPHPVRHEENPEQIVLDLAMLGIAVDDYGDSISTGVFMSM